MRWVSKTGRELALFGVVGMVATAVHYCVALALTFWLPVTWANPAGFAAAFLVSYFGHARMTFHVPIDQRDHSRRLPRFALTALSGFLVGQAALLLLNASTMLPDWLALAAALGTAPVFVFLVARAWVFAPTRQ